MNGKGKRVWYQEANVFFGNDAVTERFDDVLALIEEDVQQSDQYEGLDIEWVETVISRKLLFLAVSCAGRLFPRVELSGACFK